MLCLTFRRQLWKSWELFSGGFTGVDPIAWKLARGYGIWPNPQPQTPANSSRSFAATARLRFSSATATETESESELRLVALVSIQTRNRKTVQSGPDSGTMASKMGRVNNNGQWCGVCPIIFIQSFLIFLFLINLRKFLGNSNIIHNFNPPPNINTNPISVKSVRYWIAPDLKNQI